MTEVNFPEWKKNKAWYHEPKYSVREMLNIMFEAWKVYQDADEEDRKNFAVTIFEKLKDQSAGDEVLAHFLMLAGTHVTDDLINLGSWVGVHAEIDGDGIREIVNTGRGPGPLLATTDFERLFAGVNAKTASDDS